MFYFEWMAFTKKHGVIFWSAELRILERLLFWWHYWMCGSADQNMAVLKAIYERICKWILTRLKFFWPLTFITILFENLQTQSNHIVVAASEAEKSLALACQVYH